jgi:hypothetical protein
LKINEKDKENEAKSLHSLGTLVKTYMADVQNRKQSLPVKPNQSISVEPLTSFA